MRKLKSVVSAGKSANVIHYVTFRRWFSGTEAHTMTCSPCAERGKQPTLTGGFPHLSLPAPLHAIRSHYSWFSTALWDDTRRT
jgi:hypothetical protein